MIALQNCKFVAALPPISVSGGTATDTEVDTFGYHYAAFVIQSGLLGAAGVTTLKLQESDSAGGGADFTGNGFTALVDADDNKVYVAFIDLRKRKRYISLVATAGANACLLSALCILHRADEAPNTAAERGIAEQLLI